MTPDCSETRRFGADRSRECSCGYCPLKLGNAHAQQTIDSCSYYPCCLCSGRRLRPLIDYLQRAAGIQVIGEALTKLCNSLVRCVLSVGFIHADTCSLLMG